MVSEKEMGLTEPYISIFDKANKDYVKEQKDDDHKPFATMTDEQIEKFAKTVLVAYQLPSDRLIHIINEAKAYRYFSIFGNIENYIVLTNLRHYKSKVTLYASPSSYIIKSKKTDMESLPSTDIEKLVTEFGL